MYIIYTVSLYLKRRKEKKNIQEMTQWPGCMFAFLGAGVLLLVFFILIQHNFPLFFKSEDGWMDGGRSACLNPITSPVCVC